MTYKSQRGRVNDLPKLPEEVGRVTDIMISIKYSMYFPEGVFRLPTGGQIRKLKTKIRKIKMT